MFRGIARLSAVLLATGLAAAGTVATAAAAPSGGGADVATLGDFIHYGRVAISGPQGDEQADGGTVGLNMGGQSLAVYCIDLYHDTHNGVQYTETDWNKSTLSGNPNAGKIQWILNNSYPDLTVSQVESETGVQGLTEDSAAAATQAAIWHYSDNVTATPQGQAAQALTTWLETNATTTAEPTPTLQISPASVAGKSGEKIGPVTVTTSANSVALQLTAPSGVTVVDSKGQPATTASNGEQLFFDVPAGAAAGSAQLTASTTTTVPVGRAFAAIDGTSQTMILAGTAPIAASAVASAQWAPMGVIPAANATASCSKGGVEVTLTNAGDQPWTTTVGGQSVTVQGGSSTTVLVKVAEGAAYDITVTGPNGFSKEFKGALECKPTTPGGPTATPSAPASSSATPSASASPVGGKLASTGTSSATPIMGGVGAALILIGGGTVFFLRKRGRNA
jgi:TQXA domain-containing protein/LPXTG-motif cell wall-anchored protein